MTRGQIRDSILNALNESTTTPVFWTTAQVNALIDEAAEILAEDTKAIRRTALVARQPGSIYYATRAIASDIMAITRIWLPDVKRRLTAVSIAELDQQNRTWSTVTGDPLYWFPVSWDLFGVYPHPSTGGGILQIDYLAWPRPLQDDDDEPEFREADHDALCSYGVYDGLLKRWDVPGALALFARCIEQGRSGKARSGIRESQTRSYQRPMAPGVPFPSGVNRG